MLNISKVTKPVHRTIPINSRFAGVTVPLITPCTESGEIDYPAIRHCASELTTHGCDGIFVISSTGGMPFIDESDRVKMIAAARQGCPKHKTLYAGISGMGLSQTLRFAKQAAEEGADAAVVMSPFFLRLSQDELLNYFTDVADGCPIPLCVYHHVAMPTPVGVETMAKLAEHPNVVAIKDTSGQLDRMQELIKATRSTDLVLLQGSEPIILGTLQAGGHGCVSALAGIAPEWHQQLQRSYFAGEAERAEECQQQISALWKMFEFPQMKKSFSYFARSLAIATRYRGWCESANTVVPGAEADLEFERVVEQHLISVGLPKA
jgi:4-hydroxy-tetrahydrodipicolinate synthase